MLSPDEIIRKFEPSDYKSQALVLSESIDKLMEQKGVKAISSSLLHPAEKKELVENLKTFYKCVADLPNYKKEQ